MATRRKIRPPADARACALDVFHGTVRRGVPFDESFSAHPALRDMAERDRGFVRALTATALRRLGQIDAVLDSCLDMPLSRGNAVVRDILRLGAAQLLFLKTPPHAAVNTAVRLTQDRGRPTLCGFVNAVLRRVAREGEAAVAGQDAAKLNTPEWLWDSWVAAYGEETARAIAEANMTEPPLDFSVKSDPGGWAEKLQGTVLPTGTVRRPPASLGGGGRIAELPGFADGEWWVQDAAAAIPATLLRGVAGQTVIDLCAAPGGKTAQLAAKGAKVIAVDHVSARLELVAENLKRLRLEAELVHKDVAAYVPPAPAPFVLLDAPCTATGTMRRHPDIARQKVPLDVTRLAKIQKGLLDAAAAMVAPRGVLVFCTCSLQPEEGEQRIAAFLHGDGKFSREPVDAGEVGGIGEFITPLGDLRTLPCHLREAGGVDGFYAARLRRRD